MAVVRVVGWRKAAKLTQVGVGSGGGLQEEVAARRPKFPRDTGLSQWPRPEGREKVGLAIAGAGRAVSFLRGDFYQFRNENSQVKYLNQ